MGMQMTEETAAEITKII
jgi:hypothetical protein